ncbi:MAG: PEGA domain-containing protein, partial [Candidatus Aminicenantes bacterium]|nr:PEGA domain-containing protein [Candidatus Aminicenantes bacterium]
MKFVNLHRKPVSMFVMIAFTIMMCFWANQSPAAPAAPSTEKSSTAAAASAEEESPGFIEQEESTPVVKKGKKFPWLIVGAVVVIGAAAVYFLVLSKKYALTVNLGQGCTGTPAATAKFKKNAVVNYSYSTEAGYGSMQVKLDGAVVAASGSVTMDKVHTLDVSATYGAVVNVTSTPSGAKIYDNYVDSGKTTPASFSYTSAGSHTYLLRQCGYKDYTKAQSVVVGQTYNISATLVQGILDNFLVPATCWAP